MKQEFDNIQIIEIIFILLDIKLLQVWPWCWLQYCNAVIRQLWCFHWGIILQSCNNSGWGQNETNSRNEEIFDCHYVSLHKNVAALSDVSQGVIEMLKHCNNCYVYTGHAQCDPGHERGAPGCLVHISPYCIKYSRWLVTINHQSKRFS